MPSNQDTGVDKSRNGPCTCGVYIHPLIHVFIQQELYSTYHFSENVVDPGDTSENIPRVEAGGQKTPANSNKCVNETNVKMKG